MRLAWLLASILLATVLVASVHGHPEAPPVEGAERLPDGRWAIPLRGERPAWLTDDMEERLRRGDAVPATIPLPVEPILDQGIRPGAWMAYPGWCTFNFIFRHVPTGDYGIGTAGHCVSRVGEEVGLQSVRHNRHGSVAVPPPNGTKLPSPTDCVHVGTGGGGWEPQCVLGLPENLTGSREVVKQDVILTWLRVGLVEVLRDNGVGHDFALIRIDPEAAHLVDPAIVGIGGPCGTYTGMMSLHDGNEVRWLPPIETDAATDPLQGMPVLHYGHGLAVGAGGTPRAGLGEQPSPLTVGKGW